MPPPAPPFSVASTELLFNWRLDEDEEEDDEDDEDDDDDEEEENEEAIV